MDLRPVLILSKCITVDHIQLMLVSTRALKALVLKLNYKYIPWKAQIEEVFFTFFFYVSLSGICQLLESYKGFAFDPSIESHFVNVRLLT